MKRSKTNPRRRRQHGGLLAGLPAPLMLALGGVLLVGSALFALAGFNRPAQTGVPIEVAGAPNLEVDRELVDLGDVPLDKIVSVSFQLTNTGDEILRFSQAPYVEVREGC